MLESDDPNHDDRGRLLHFDVGLRTRKIPGSFGWDTPASAPFYLGPAGYLIMNKYNNYLGAGLLGDGQSRIALLGPA